MVKNAYIIRCHENNVALGCIRKVEQINSTLIMFMYGSRVAQWKRAGPITQRSVDRNHALLIYFFPIKELKLRSTLFSLYITTLLLLCFSLMWLILLLLMLCRLFNYQSVHILIALDRKSKLILHVFSFKSWDFELCRWRNLV